ncbi:MAG: shikimate dehydrogenase [Crocinitomicaceae bacterium]|nr:shikimate dehydrogenase [Crocinitomicaceae bacterium]
MSKQQFGLLGKRLDYSFSKSFFTDYFLKHQLEAVFSNLETSDLATWMKSEEAQQLDGFSVTIPYKQEIIPFLDSLSPEAAAIGAVNVVQRKDGKLIGHNTDAFGFKQSIKPFLDFRHQKALILGTGGASKAIAYVLKNIGLDVLYVSRNPQGENQFGYEEVNEYMLKACKMIVNCTPLGTSPNLEEAPEIPFEFITNDHFVVDLIYNPEQTKLLREAANRGAITLNGLSMLKEQALKAWEIWNQK